MLLWLSGGHLPAQTSLLVKTATGELQGVSENHVRIFKGIPYAKAPLGDLRWKEPQPLLPWKGIRKADQFGARAMQRFIYKDMMFRSAGVSEDCLYLNVWTPANSTNQHLPVLVYFHGGGLSAGDGSEWRYDGSAMSRRGVIMVTVNYRLGIFGFLSHPELTKESPHRQSGNYGFLDQRAALLWVKTNISAFGGDPDKVTIAGQSAGSISVSAHMASPLSKGLFRAAIGESGSILAALPAIPLVQAEQNGMKFCQFNNLTSLKDLRQLSADQLLEITARDGSPGFSPTIDGYFLPASPMDIFATGLQTDIPLLAGWTSAEVTYHRLFGSDELTIENYQKKIKLLYPEKSDEVLKFYPATSNETLLQSATDLASDRYIAYSTWKWLDLHAKTSGSTVYRYLFAKKHPPLVDSAKGNKTLLLGAPHSSDIEYALGNLSSNKVYAWTAIDDSVSNIMQSYFVNFIAKGDPNADGLPYWPGMQSSIPKVMVLDSLTQAQPEKNLRRYVFLDQFYYK